MELEKAMKQAQLSVEIEDKQIKPQHTQLVRSRLMNEISEEEFQETVRRIVKKGSF